MDVVTGLTTETIIYTDVQGHLRSAFLVKYVDKVGTKPKTSSLHERILQNKIVNALTGLERMAL